MRETLHLTAGSAADLARAAAILRSGGLVAFPTETVYGLGANALSDQAVAGIFHAKQRPSWDPLIVHLAEATRMEEITVLDADLRPRVHRLIEAFWPGPLTILLPRTSAIPDAVTAGRATVGVRVPAHPVAQALLRAAAVPVAAPSANRFGHVSPTSAQHVLDDLRGRIDAVLDGGSTLVGVESTVLDPAPTPMVLYRAGAVTPAMLEQASGTPVRVFSAEERDLHAASPGSLPSPGVGMRHYAPEARLILTGPSLEELEQEIQRALSSQSSVGVLLPGDWSLADLSVSVVVERWGRWNDPESLAHGLFAALRGLERHGVRVIVCPLPQPGGGLLEAVRDRLLKAARTH